MKGFAQLHYRNDKAEPLAQFNSIHPKDYHAVGSPVHIADLHNPGDVVDMVEGVWVEQGFGRPPASFDVLTMQITGQHAVKGWMIIDPDRASPSSFWRGTDIKDMDIWNLGCKHAEFVATTIPFLWNDTTTRLRDLEE